MKALHIISFILVVIGGLDWGILGIGGFFGANWNFVNLLLGNWPQLEGTVYILVGLATLVLLFSHKKDCKMCSAK